MLLMRWFGSGTDAADACGGLEVKPVLVGA